MKTLTKLAIAGLLTATTLGAGFAFAQSNTSFGERGTYAQGLDGKQTAWGGSKKIKRMAKRMCNEEMTAKRQEKMTAVDAFVAQHLDLNAEQSALYDAAKTARQGASEIRAQACTQIEAGERPDRSAMRSAKEPVRDALQAFEASLTEAQKATWDLVKPKMKKGGERRGKHQDRNRDDRDHEDRDHDDNDDKYESSYLTQPVAIIPSAPAA